MIIMCQCSETFCSIPKILAVASLCNSLRLVLFVEKINRISGDFHRLFNYPADFFCYWNKPSVMGMLLFILCVLNLIEHFGFLISVTYLLTMYMQIITSDILFVKSR